MYGEDFSERLSKLRNQKGVSARDMSLSIGQNPCYINNIENGKMKLERSQHIQSPNQHS